MAEKKSAEWYAATRVWWAALLESAGGDRKLVLKWLKEAARRQPGWNGNPVTDKMLSNYLESRGGRPQTTELRKATEQVMRERVPSPPAGVPPKWHNLNHLMYPDAAETGPVKPKRAPVRVAALDKALLDDPDFTVDEATSLEGMRRWFLQSSWVTDNQTPPYVPRSANLVDDTIRHRLALAAQPRNDAGGVGGGLRGGVVVVSGPPKAGKTRTLLEALRHVRPDARLWRVKTAPGALDAIHKSLTNPGRDGGFDPAQVVLLLDDLQRYDFSTTDAVTDKLLTRLLATGVTVAATIHTDFLTELSAHQHDRRRSRDDSRIRIGASAELVSMLTDPDALVTLDPVLTADELKHIDPELISRAASRGIDQDRFARLPELLAAVDHLKARADNGLNDYERPHLSAIIYAAVDAAYIYPAGATLDQLEELARCAYLVHWPTRMWRSSYFETAFEWATMPIGGPGSNHAVLQPTPEGRVALFEPLASYVLKDPWTTRHLRPYKESLPSASFRIGLTHHLRNEFGDAAFWFEVQASVGVPDAILNLGIAKANAGDVAGGRFWLERGAKNGDARAMSALAFVSALEGDSVNRDHWMNEALAKRDPWAMMKMMLSREEDSEQWFDGFFESLVSGNKEVGITFVRLLLIMGLKDEASRVRRDLESWWSDNEQ